ncbi:MAG: Trm112 family protein [Nitrospirota bacterium]
MLTENLLKLLACPKCKGNLVHDEKEKGCDPCEQLTCSACSLVYPIENDIPMLVIERAVTFNRLR